MLLHLPPGSTRLMPTTADLVARALADTDFLNDITPRTRQLELLALAATATDMAIDAWEAANELPVGSTDVALTMVFQTRRILVARASELMRERVAAEEDARSDAIEAGDIDSHGNAMPYARYRSA